MADADRACLHETFAAVVTVSRMEPDASGMPKAFIAEITVNCGACSEPFRFTGVPAGYSFAHPMVSVDEATLNAPIRPASADPDFGLGLPGFAVRRVV